MALYPNRDRVIILEIKQIWLKKKKHCRIKSHRACIICPSLLPLSLNDAFQKAGIYEKLNISKMHTEFQGPGCPLAFAAETQFVGFRKEAGRYRSGTRVDSGPGLFPIRARQSSFNVVLANGWTMGAAPRRTMQMGPARSLRTDFLVRA